MTGSAPPTARQVAGRRWRRSRVFLLAVLALIVVAIALAMLRPSHAAAYLDPESPNREGVRALAQITQQRGTPVRVTRGTDEAVSRMRAEPGALLVITRTERLLPDQRSKLRDVPGERLLIDPDDEALAALAPGVTRAGSALASVPDCTLPAATRAGSVAFGRSAAYQAAGDAIRCYSGALVRAGPVTVLGSGGPLTNERLDQAGNAALGMNLLGSRDSVVWLIPDLPPPGSDTDKSAWELVPFGVKLAILQVIIAVFLVALWRSRRLGPVVSEPLPVIVRSAEAVEGRARLYRARGATDRAADALRMGALERIVPLLGLRRAAVTDPAAINEIVASVAVRAGQTEAVTGRALYGPPPEDDVELVALADLLDVLERQVRQS